MVDFRYAQFCPLTRAVEILGERWTVLIVRELYFGPKRFSDLKAALNGVSPSVLAERLARLEERKIVGRRELPPPAASLVYELDEAGRALRPLLTELTRWGLHFVGVPSPDDSCRPEWMLLGLQVFARGATRQKLAARLHVEGGGESVDLFVSGGPAGTTVSREKIACDLVVTGSPVEMLMFMSGLLAPDDPGASSTFRYTGSLSAVRRLPALFDFSPTPPVSEATRVSASGSHGPSVTHSDARVRTGASGSRKRAVPSGALARTGGKTSGRTRAGKTSGTPRRAGKKPGAKRP